MKLSARNSCEQKAVGDVCKQDKCTCADEPRQGHGEMSGSLPLSKQMRHSRPSAAIGHFARGNLSLNAAVQANRAKKSTASPTLVHSPSGRRTLGMQSQQLLARSARQPCSALCVAKELSTRDRSDSNEECDKNPLLYQEYVVAFPCRCCCLSPRIVDPCSRARPWRS